jgi:hypothetical protein
MAISYRSQTFQETKQKLNSLAREGLLSKENYRDTVQSLGVDPDDFIAANKQFIEAGEKGELDTRGRGVIYGVPDIAERTVGRALGETYEGIAGFASAITPDFIEKPFTDMLDAVGEYVPDSVKEFASETFDPYHGEGFIAGAENITGTIGSYLIPYTGVVKVAKGATTLGKAVPGVRATITNAKRKLGRKGRRYAKYAGMGLAGSAATTIVEDPRDNLFDMLMEDDEGEKLVRRAAETGEYDDPNLLDYLDAFVKNTAIELPASMLLGLPRYLAKALNVTDTVVPRKKITARGRIGAEFSSTLGTDKDTANKIFFRKGEQKAAEIKTNALVQELKDVATDELGDWESSYKLINGALQYSDDALARAERRLEFFQNKEQRLVNELAQEVPGTVSHQKKAKKLKEVREESLPLANNILNDLRRNKVDYDQIAQAGGRTKNIIDEMRTNLDDLSKYAIDNVVSDSLQVTFDNNLGTYLNRSYEVFDDANFRKALNKRFDEWRNGKTYNPTTGQLENVGNMPTDDVIEGVARHLQSMGTPADEIVETIREIIPKTADDAGLLEFLGARGMDKFPGTSKVLTKRGEFADPIRFMWGEVDDPLKNYSNTFSKLSLIKAENEFLTELAEEMVANGVAKRGMSEGIKDINLRDVGLTRFGRIVGKGNAQQGKVNNPLEGIYVDPIYAKAIQDGFDEIMPDQGKALKYWMKAKGWSQNAKTVLSPATHGRNLIGNIFILTANGITPGVKSSAKALEQTAAFLANKTNRELADIAAEYARLGVTNSGVNVNIMRRNLNAIKKSGGEDWMDKTIATRGLKKTNNFLQNLYQSEDDMFKIIHFEETKKMLSKAYPNKNSKEIAELAAQRTRDLMPNYDAVPRALKRLRGQWFGADFIAFPAEMARVTKNLMKYTYADAMSGNKELQKAAAKRAAGTTVVGLGPAIWSADSRYVNNISDEQEEAINNVVPSYEAFQDRIYLSGINKDKVGHVGVNYLSMGPLDPFAFMKSAAKGIIRASQSGSLTDEDAQKAALATFENAVGPFVSPSMITKAALDLVDGKTYSNEPGIMGKIQNGLSIAVGPLTPGVANFLNKRKAYEQTKGDTWKLVSPLMGDFSDSENLPEGIGPGDFTISGYAQTFGGEVGIPAFFGLRNQRLDLTARAKYALQPSINKINNSSRIFTDGLKPINATKREIYDAYVKSQRQRLNGFQELKSINDSFGALFGEDYGREMVKALKFRTGDPVSKQTADLLNDTRQNIFRPGVPDYGRAEYYSGAPIPYDSILAFFKHINGTKIEED